MCVEIIYVTVLGVIVLVEVIVGFETSLDILIPFFIDGTTIAVYNSIQIWNLEEEAFRFSFFLVSFFLVSFFFQLDDAAGDSKLHYFLRGAL